LSNQDFFFFFSSPFSQANNIQILLVFKEKGEHSGQEGKRRIEQKEGRKEKGTGIRNRRKIPLVDLRIVSRGVS